MVPLSFVSQPQLGTCKYHYLSFPSVSELHEDRTSSALSAPTETVWYAFVEQIFAEIGTFE